MLKTHHCEHKYQDAMYGLKERVHTVGNKFYTCTVCGTTTHIPQRSMGGKKEKNNA